MVLSEIARSFDRTLGNNSLEFPLIGRSSSRSASTWRDSGTLCGRPIFIFSPGIVQTAARSEEHTSELRSLMRISYAVFCLKKKQPTTHINTLNQHVQNAHT